MKLVEKRYAVLMTAVLVFGGLCSNIARAEFGGGAGHDGPPGMMHEGRGFMHMGPNERWWDDPQKAQKLGITPEQRKKMDDLFESNRLQLIDGVAALEKAEVQMEPLMSADQPDEHAILAQIDRVAQARAELEKNHARFLLGLRAVLTHDQWVKLQAERRERMNGNRFDGSAQQHGNWGKRGPRDGDGPGGPPPTQGGQPGTPQ